MQGQKTSYYIQACINALTSLASGMLDFRQVLGLVVELEGL